MSRIIRIRISEAAARRLEVAGKKRGLTLPQAAADLLAAAARWLPAVAVALPRATAPKKPDWGQRRWRVNAPALDAAEAPERTRSVTASLMGDPERGK